MKAQTTHLPGVCHAIRVISQLVILSYIAVCGSLPECHWPVDEVEVQVVQLEVLEGNLAGRKDILLRMLSVPT